MKGKPLFDQVRGLARGRGVGLAALGALVALAFGAAWRGNWILDDFHQVANNPYLSRWSDYFYLVSHSVWEAAAPHHWSPLYRPTMMVSFLILRQGFGLAPAVFHLWNFFIHFFNAFLLLHLLEKGWGNRRLALILAALFAVHPLASEAVVWISGIQDLYCLTFPLLLFHCLWPGEKRSWDRWGLAAICFFLALLSKEIAILLPLPLFALSLGQPRQQRKKEWIALAGFCAVSIGSYLLLRRAVIGRHTFQSEYLYGGFFRDLFLALEIFIRNFLWPDPLKFHRPFTPSDLGVFWAGATALFVAVAAAWGAWRLKKQRDFRPLFAFSLILYPLIPVSMYAGMTRIMAERYFYVPLAGALLLLGGWVAPGGRERPFAKRLLAVASGVALLALLLTARQYAAAWNDESTLFGHALRHPPVSHEIYYDLGLQAAEAGDLGQAERFFRQALDRWPEYGRGMNNLGVVLLRQKRPAEALGYFERLLRQDPRAPRPWFNRGLALWDLGRAAEAAESFRRCLAQEPIYPQARLWLRQSEQAAGRQGGSAGGESPRRGPGVHSLPH